MSLTGMRLRNYRCFPDTGFVELKPLTLVLGKNNSGKSALVRAPLVWSTGFRTTSPVPLDLELIDDLKIVDSFTDLIHGGRPHGSIRGEFRLGDSTFTATIQNVDELRTQIITHVGLIGPQVEYSVDWQSDSPLDAPLYVIDDGSPEVRLPSAIAFAGLECLEPDAANLNPSYPRIRYLGPFRQQPEWRYRFPRRLPADVGVSGQNALGVLARSREVLDRLNPKLREWLPGWEIDITEFGGMYSVFLFRTDNPQVRVNVADTGAGVAQALPLYIQRALDETRRPTGSVLEIVEQPELHLHPAAHAALADLYVKAVGKATRFLIETHSETLLLRLRRRIAEGRLNADDVAIYFVEHDGSTAQVRRIKIDHHGNLDYWPRGVFSEDYDELRELAKAQEVRSS
jgi:hypothetical protein